ncbi:MAG: hypothetical protein U0105_15915 [Candidatus Obscuribacterales bacterium]
MIGAVWRGFWVLGILAAVGVAVLLDSLLLMLFAVWGLDDINEKFMPVHPVFYYALGMTTLIASCFTGESLGGAMIAVFAIIHGLIAHKKNRLKQEEANNTEYVSAPFATQREVEEFAGRMPQVEGSTPLRDRLVGLKKPLTPVRNLRQRDFPTVSGIASTAGDGSMVQRMLSNQAYFSVPKSQRILIGAVYVGLAVTLSGTLYWMHQAGLFHRPH